MPFIEHIKTPIGFIKVCASETAITSIAFCDVADADCPNNLTQQAAVQLHDYFGGSRTAFQLPLAVTGSAFQEQIWHLVAEIAFGKTMGYTALSQRYGDAKAIRAVAAANGKNPFAIVVPCHRVVGTHGALTGYAWGLERKEWLLKHEGALSATLF